MLVYDIEVYPNLFLVCFQNPLDKERQAFEISPWKDNRKELYFFLKSCKDNNVTLVGFNNLEYDWLILRKFIRVPKKKQQELNKLIFLESQNVINTRMFDFSPEVKQLDLRKIHHYDNVAKMTSLKLLEFNMGMESIEDLPYPFDKELTRQERDEIISYCWNDVDATSMFYEHSKSKIKFRERMSEIYDVNFTNANDVKIGETILLKALAKGWNKEEKDIKKLRTHREFMKVEDIILPYVTFNSVEFNTLLDWWKTKTIYQTKGQFSELDLDDVEPLLEYCDNTLKKGRLKKLNILYGNMQFDFGTGGIHGYSKPGLWVSDDEYDLILVDVSSYYPNLARFNGFHPEHLPKEIFIQVIETLYLQRMEGKKNGDNEIVSAIKLALNGALYGKSNSEYSFMYDPMFMMKICLNGQLLLVSLCEQIMDENIEVIQINTDGILCKVHKSQRERLDFLCDKWMELTKLSLDYDFFNLVVQRDVNNYLGRMTNGYIKRKGAFDWKYAENGDWHKNFSQLAVYKAVEAYYINGISIEESLETIKNTEPELFFKRVKLSHKLHKLVLEDTVLQKVTRYLVTTEGGTLLKIMPPLKGKIDIRQSNIEKGYLCTEYNKLRIIKNIDMEYYTQECLKIIEKCQS